MRHQRAESFAISPDVAAGMELETGRSDRSTALFDTCKRIFDIVFSIALLPLLILMTLALLIVNPAFNRGPVFYVQQRMGKGTKAFPAIKFRSMRVAARVERGAHDPLETDRITPFGRFLRKTRLDEIPQIINVLKGEMSLVGPRPDYIVHAEEYLSAVPGYRRRFAVKPGISGLAQTEVGYADTTDAVVKKVSADLYYIRNRNARLELWIVWRTLLTVFGRKGS